MLNPLRDKTAITGIGQTDYMKNSGVSTLALALQAIRAAATDAGLALSDLDGVACHRVGDSAPAVAVAHALGIQDLRFHYDIFGGGSTSAGVVGAAAMAVATGMAEHVVCWRAVNARSEFRMGGTGRAAPDALEFQYQTPYGVFAPPQQFALYSRAWMQATGTTEEDLGRVAIVQREFAALNPRAMQRSALTMDDYLAARWVVEPYRLYDCCLETDAAVALIVTSAERARDLATPPVLISGAAYGSGHTWFSNDRGDFTVRPAKDMAKRLYAMAGVGPGDIDIAQLYDCFTPTVLMQLEDYGFCGRGEAAAMVADGATGFGGSLPVNTHGGHLSAGYVHGLNHAYEAVEQLRGQSGERQVPCDVALSTAQPGYVAGCTGGLVLRCDT